MVVSLGLSVALISCLAALFLVLFFVLFLFFILVFVIGSCSAAQSGLELIVLLLLSQDDRYDHILLLFCILSFVSFTRDLEQCILAVSHSLL